MENNDFVLIIELIDEAIKKLNKKYYYISKNINNIYYSSQEITPLIPTVNEWCSTAEFENESLLLLRTKIILEVFSQSKYSSMGVKYVLALCGYSNEDINKVFKLIQMEFDESYCLK